MEVERNDHTPAYESNWASIFSLPDRWVTKALHESLSSHPSGTFPTPIFNQPFENIDEFRSPFLQYKRPKEKNLNTCSDGKVEESSIFSEEFFITCLKTQLEVIEENLVIKRHVNKMNCLSADDIKKVINDDTYR